MATLTGILVDVSGSMRESAGGRINEEGGEWARSIFKVIDDLVKHDVSSDNHVFSVGIGASCGEGIFDVIKTVQQFQNRRQFQNGRQEQSFDNVLEDFFLLMERNGAKSMRKWASKEIMKRAVPQDTAVFILDELKRNSNFLNEFVNECLPSVCRDWPGASSRSLVDLTVGSLRSVCTSAVAMVRVATYEDIVMVRKKAEGRLSKHVGTKGRFLEDVGNMGRLLEDVGTIFSVHSASNIVHGCVDQDELNDDRIRELLESVEPYIYGGTPLFEALGKTHEIFSKNSDFSEHKKLLFVLSDGQPTDRGNLEGVISMLKDVDVTIVSCFITRSTSVRPRQLYSTEHSSWDAGAKFLFQLSSTISTQLLPRTIFIKCGWDIDITNNETKLFVQVNHPDNIHDACDLARNVVCSRDALSDLLVSVSLDIYINQSTTGFTAQRQKKSTCYANASAAVLHLAIKRIIRPANGYPDFNSLRAEMIDLGGKEGANTINVLKQICPKYDLHYQEVDVKGAMKAITAKRPVVSTFCLTNPEWLQFTEFYDKNPTGILTKSEIDISKRGPGDHELVGHAFVLTSFNSECLRFMNSWGDKWADMGFCRVQSAEVLNLKFIDVFWTLNDLSIQDKDYYRVHGAEVAGKLITKLTGLQKAKYKCPLCKVESLVTDYTGSLSEAVCPSCEKKFRSDEAGNILALNMYLTSLTR